MSISNQHDWRFILEGTTETRIHSTHNLWKCKVCERESVILKGETPSPDSVIERWTGMTAQYIGCHETVIEQVMKA